MAKKRRKKLCLRYLDTKWITISNKVDRKLINNWKVKIHSEDLGGHSTGNAAALQARSLKATVVNGKSFHLESVWFKSKVYL